MAAVRKAEESAKKMESLARIEAAVKAREDKLSAKSSSTPSESSPAAPAGDAPAGDAPAGDAPAGDAPEGAAPAAIMGGYRINSLLKIDQELEKIKSYKKKINTLLHKEKYEKLEKVRGGGGNIQISDNSNFIPNSNFNKRIVTVNTFSDSPTSSDTKYSPVSEYRQNLNSIKNLNTTLFKLKNEVPLNENLNKLLSKFI
jgi:hypothetical protein